MADPFKKETAGRRRFLKQGSAVLTGAASAAMAPAATAQNLGGEAWERVYGAPFNGYGQPSRFEQPVQRHIAKPYGDLAPGSGVALSPIERLEGIITPAGLHNNRSHSGVPDAAPARHRLTPHGPFEPPLALTMDAVPAFPMTSPIPFAARS